MPRAIEEAVLELYVLDADILALAPFANVQKVPIGDPCWLPGFTIKLRDASKCVCPMRAYKSVTVACLEPDAFDVVHVSSGSSTHEMGRVLTEGAGPLEYDDVGRPSFILICMYFFFTSKGGRATETAWSRTLRNMTGPKMVCSESFQSFLGDLYSRNLLSPVLLYSKTF